jgi:uncharacterized membrane protein YphA (DoxX/SURF4 family)
MTIQRKTIEETALWACRMVLAAVFIFAAVPKILNPHIFALQVFRYQVLPYDFVNVVAVFLPWLELFCGIALLFVRQLRDGATFLVFGMLIFFTVATAANIFRGIDISCGCFSADPNVSRIGWKKVAENSAMAVMAAYCLWYGYRASSRAAPDAA